MNKIIQGDCLEEMKKIPDNSVDSIVTDPPYEITATGGGIGRRRDYLSKTAGFTDGGFDLSILNEFDNWMVFSTLRTVPALIERAKDRRWMLITWHKPDPTPLCNGNYLPDTEYIIHAFRSKCLHGDCRDKARYIVRPSMKTDGGHPNEKPLDVMEKCIRNASPRGGLVCDPYMGSGTTGVACVRLGRQFIGIEIDPGYFAIAKRRIQDELAKVKFLEPPKRDTQRRLIDE